MSETEWFKVWFNSYYYHQLYFMRDEADARRFITNLVDYLKIPKGGHVLDVASGRGRHSNILHENGYDVTGIDISEESIAYANQQASEGLQFYVHDMRLPFWINYFDAAFNLFTSFGYFRTRREDDAALRTIAQSLRKGGKLVLDYLNVDLVEKNLVPHEEKIINGTIYHIERWQDEYHFYKKITIEHPSFDLPKTFQETVSKFRLNDFETLFSKQHLKLITTFGNYELQPATPEAPRLILVAEKEG